MEDSYPSSLQFWQSWTMTMVQDMPGPSGGRILAGPHNPAEFADRLYACEALNPMVAYPRSMQGTEPYTLQWFLDIENQRHSRQGRWIPRLLEFAKHGGETLLGLGNGLGTDWLQYARHGADVVICSPVAEQLALTRRNFELRGLRGRFLHATPSSLPLESAAIDVVCVSGLLDEVENPKSIVDEIYRVLKPGGKVLAVAPARYDVDFWIQSLFPWQRWLRRGKKIISTAPYFRFRRKELRRLFDRFVEHRIHKRHLHRSEVPHIWRWVPLPILERMMGRVLVLKAFKPLSAAIALPLAA